MKHSIVIATVILGLLSPAMAETVVGLHIGTKHFDTDKQWNDVNPGVYAKFNNGFTAGVFKNSESKTAYYLGTTVSKSVSQQLEFSATMGVMRGYSQGTMLFVLPSVAYKFDDYALRLGYVPKINKQGASGLHLMFEQRF
jgi:hypothetical protein